MAIQRRQLRVIAHQGELILLLEEPNPPVTSEVRQSLFGKALDFFLKSSTLFTQPTAPLQTSTGLEGFLKKFRRLLSEPPNTLDKNEKWGRNILHHAVCTQNVDIVAYVLTQCPNIDTNIPDTFMYSPLQLAVSYGCYDISKLLLSHNAKADYKNAASQTALHIAAKRNDVQTLKLLLSHGVNINAKDTDCQNALCLATQGRGLSAVKFLLEHGAAVNDANEGPYSCLSYACSISCPDIAMLLIKNGAKQKDTEELMARAVRMKSLELVIQMCEAGFSPVRRDFLSEESALLVAIKKQLHSFINYILSQVFTESPRGKDNRATAMSTILHLYTSNTSLKYNIMQRYLKLEESCGYTINCRNNILKAAIEATEVNTIEFMLEYGISLSQSDRDDLVARILDILEEEGNLYECVASLAQYGVSWATLRKHASNMLLNDRPNLSNYLDSINKKTLSLKAHARIAIINQLNVLPKPFYVSVQQLNLPNHLYEYVLLDNPEISAMFARYGKPVSM